MHEHALKVLEFGKVADILAAYTVTSRGKRLAQAAYYSPSMAEVVAGNTMTVQRSAPNRPILSRGNTENSIVTAS